MNQWTVLTKETNVELLNCFAKIDSVFYRQLHTSNGSNGFKGTSKTIQNDLIQSIDAVIFNEILKGVNSSSFFSIIADEATVVTVKSQFSITLRFMNNNNQHTK